MIAPSASIEMFAIDHRFPYPVGDQHGYVSYLTLFDRYADSEIGQHHSRQVPRFVEHFGYDAENNYRQMVEDLGFNAHPRDHMQSTYDMTLKMFFHEYMNGGLEKLARWLPAQEFPVVRLVTPFHDMGENTSPIIAAQTGGVIGDIAHGGKTPADKVLESKIRTTVFGMFYGDLPDHLIKRVESISAHAEDTPAHTTYNWAHDLEALQTARLAAGCVLRAIDTKQAHDLRFGQLIKLARQVGARTSDALRPATKRFGHVQVMLDQSERLFEKLEARI